MGVTGVGVVDVVSFAGVDSFLALSPATTFQFGRPNPAILLFPR
jgi:hypothetical protein